MKGSGAWSSDRDELLDGGLQGDRAAVGLGPSAGGRRALPARQSDGRRGNMASNPKTVAARWLGGRASKGEHMSKIEEMVDVLRQWQGLERQAMNDTAQIMERTASPLIRIVMEIIRHDSLMHHRVEQFLIDSVTKDAVTVTREDIVEVWEALEAHDRAERKTIQMAEELRKKAWSPVHKLLLDYLLKEESKHDSLIAQLDAFKKELAKGSGA
jgi:hypothetical protein